MTVYLNIEDEETKAALEAALEADDDSVMMRYVLSHPSAVATLLAHHNELDFDEAGFAELRAIHNAQSQILTAGGGTLHYETPEGVTSVELYPE